MTVLVYILHTDFPDADLGEEDPLPPDNGNPHPLFAFPGGRSQCSWGFATYLFIKREAMQVDKVILTDDTLHNVI